MSDDRDPPAIVVLRSADPEFFSRTNNSHPCDTLQRNRGGGGGGSSSCSFSTMVGLKRATTSCLVQKEKTQTRITFNNLSANLTVSDLYKYVQLHLEEDRPFELSLVCGGGGGGGDSPGVGAADLDLKSSEKVRSVCVSVCPSAISLGLCDLLQSTATDSLLYYYPPSSVLFSGCSWNGVSSSFLSLCVSRVPICGWFK